VGGWVSARACVRVCVCLQGLAGAAGEGVVVEGLDGDADEARIRHNGGAGDGGGGHEVGEDGDGCWGGAGGARVPGERAVEEARLVGVGEPGREGLRWRWRQRMNFRIGGGTGSVGRKVGRRWAGVPQAAILVFVLGD
jgi:hypothetical protein